MSNKTLAEIYAAAPAISLQSGDLFYLARGEIDMGIPANVLSGIQIGILGADETRSNMNSTTYVDSITGQITLGVGTYFLESEASATDGDVGTAGSKIRVVFGGTGIITGDVGSVGGADEADGVSVTRRFATFGQEASHSSVALYARWTGKIVVTVAGALKIQSAQKVANASDHKLLRGSYIRATRIV